MAVRNVTLEMKAAKEALSTQEASLQEAQLKLGHLEETLVTKRSAEQMVEWKAGVAKEKALWRLRKAQQQLSASTKAPLTDHEMAQSQRAVKVLRERIFWQSLRTPTQWRLRTTKVFEHELEKKSRQIDESHIIYEQIRMAKEDVALTAAQMVRAEDEAKKEKDRLASEVAQLEEDVCHQHQSVQTQEDLVTRASSKLRELREELTLHGDDAVLAKILRRATLPEGPRPRRAMQLAKQMKMDWCCITASAEGKATSLSLAEFMDTPECGKVKELAETYGPRSDFEFVFWFPSNEIQAGRYLRLSAQLWPKLNSPLYKNHPTQLNFFELLRASLGDSQFSDVWLVPEAPHFHQKALGLDRMTDFVAPKAVAPHLRPYQLAGFRWMACLCKNGLGAVLADDMGLGKTLQCISVLLYLKEQKLLTNEENQKCPALVVVPPGLLQNWQREFRRWAPTLSFYVYHGPKRSLPPNKGRDYDLLLSTYEVVRNDREKFADAQTICFSGMVIDEAQKIKNHGALVSRAMKEVGNAIGHTRIALSGTPIENKVDELHSIFDFVNYGYLGTQENFAMTFSRIIEKGGDSQKKKESLELLKRLTTPFQMRRLKTDPNILPDLPDKIDISSTTHLTKEQEKLYLAIQEDFRSTMTQSRETAGTNHAFQRRGHIFAMLEQVRRVCSHPLCLERDQYPQSCKNMVVQQRVESSGKTSRLVELLEEILPAKEKAVVFCTRKAIISVLKKLICDRFNFSDDTNVLVFTGDLSLQERAGVENRFQTDPRCQVLLITLQCGGIGLNLTAANHVIHFDRCYNPAKEAQATDRCHRLGQKRSVCVHRLITEGTYEEQLEKIMARKQDLSSLTVTRAEDWIADYDDEALFDLFMLRTGSARRHNAPLQTPPRAPAVQGHATMSAPKRLAPTTTTATTGPTSPAKKPRGK